MLICCLPFPLCGFGLGILSWLFCVWMRWCSACSCHLCFCFLCWMMLLYVTQPISHITLHCNNTITAQHSTCQTTQHKSNNTMQTNTHNTHNTPSFLRSVSACFFFLSFSTTQHELTLVCGGEGETHQSSTNNTITQCNKHNNIQQQHPTTASHNNNIQHQQHPTTTTSHNNNIQQQQHPTTTTSYLLKPLPPSPFLLPSSPSPSLSPSLSLSPYPVYALLLLLPPFSFFSSLVRPFLVVVPACRCEHQHHTQCMYNTLLLFFLVPFYPAPLSHALPTTNTTLIPKPNQTLHALLTN